jgi:hypothetical protein
MLFLQLLKNFIYRKVFMKLIIQSVLKYLFAVSVFSFIFLQFSTEIALAKVDETKFPAGQSPAVPVGACGDRNNSSCAESVGHAATVTSLAGSSNSSEACPYCRTGDANVRDAFSNAQSGGGVGTGGTGIDSDTKSEN